MNPGETPVLAPTMGSAVDDRHAFITYGVLCMEQLHSIDHFPRRRDIAEVGLPVSILCIYNYSPTIIWTYQTWYRLGLQ